MKILHIAPINVAGVPYNMVQMHKRFGHQARLVSLHRNSLSFPEDICLNLPLPRNSIANLWRSIKRSKTEKQASAADIDTYLPIHGSKNIFEELFFRLDDIRRARKIYDAIENYELEDYDIIHYDGGLDLFRDARIAKRWKREGKKIVCHYMGSDLRLRGIHPVLDSLSDLNLTNESDHLLRHPNIHYIYIPFDCSSIQVRKNENERLRIIHSPTDRSMKGTNLILPVIEKLEKIRDIEFILAENMPHNQILALKQNCDIAIEQVGNMGGTGYGRNSIETLAMGIPTITEMTPDYSAWLPENPFFLADSETLLDRLVELIDNASLRKTFSENGRKWVEKYHSYEAVNNSLMKLYKEHRII